MIRRLIIIAFLSISALNLSARYSVGIRDSRYVYGTFTTNHNLSIGLEHSLYSEKMGFQRVGASLSYTKSLPLGLSVKTGCLVATTWNGNYQVVSTDAAVIYDLKRFQFNAIINPRYDSGIHYMTCWEAGALYKITKPVSILVNYTTIPLYRMSEKRIAGGFKFKVHNLSVKPMLSISMDKTTRFKNLRVLMSMSYIF